MNLPLKKILPYVIALVVFVVVAITYFSPVLKGEKIFQSDIHQFKGMSKEIKDFRNEHGTEPYWTDAAFGGMPSYQLSTYYPNDYVKKIDSLIRFLPRPADYLFLYFFGFFILLLVLRFDWKLAMIGSLAFGFSTYFIIILGVGHNAKAHAIGYIPLVLAGFLLVFQQKYFKGFLLSTLALALEINASHPQMSYYLLFALLILGIAFLTAHLKKKADVNTFVKSVAVFVLAGVLALGMNASSLMATKEYASYSTRGKSELTITPEGIEKEASTGLTKEYITEYSYGIVETFNLLIPRFTGGANGEDLGEDSNTYAFLSQKIGRSQAKQFAKNVPTYWGSQPIVAAPAYIGAIFIFLFVLALYLVKGKIRNGLIGVTIFSILMSWGHNFSPLTDFFIEYVPLYNKFRAVSSIQILAEICIPLLGLLGLKAFVVDDISKDEKLEALKKAFYVLGGLTLFFTILGPFLFSFEGKNDAYFNSQLPGFAQALIEDRKAIFFKDSLRSFVFISLTALMLWLYHKEKVKKNIAYLSIAILLLFDMVGAARRYVNEDDFQSSRKIENAFVKTSIDKEILKDKGHYRVANFSGNFMNDGLTSYFHKSIGGYHAAKMGRYQELVEFHISKNNMEVLNMLNTKYFIFSNEKGRKGFQENPDANGPVWFVDSIQTVASANEEIMALKNFDSKKTAIINTPEFSYQSEDVFESESDSLAKIELISYQANKLEYTSETNKKALAVFSEIYYKEGWNAYIDGNYTPHLRANYVLRAMVIPAGKHNITFKFEPTVIITGSYIVLSSIVLFVLIVIFMFYKFKRKQQHV